jgi:hypothetical protein
MDGIIVDESAVGGIEVADEDGATGDQEFAMETGYGGIVDAEIVGGIASDAEKSVHQIDGSGVGDPGQH